MIAFVGALVHGAYLGAVFWAIRCVAQLVWLRINHVMVHVLSALFALGAVLFALPLLAR